MREGRSGAGSWTPKWNGGSDRNSARTGTPVSATRDAAYRPITAPEEWPSTAASPPAPAMTAARSSASRRTENGFVSPLSPRARRSYVIARRPASASAAPSAAASFAVDRAPLTITTAGPDPVSWTASRVPSAEVT